MFRLFPQVRVLRLRLGPPTRKLSTLPSADFIASGPVFRAAQLPRPVGSDLSRWHHLGGSILTGSSEEALRRTYHLALPVYFYLSRLHAQPRRNANFVNDQAPPLVVGIQCLQGGGKTTLCDQLVELFGRESLKAVALSIDDFYLTHAELTQLAADEPLQPLLHGRGNPGTHDVRLMEQTMQKLVAGGRVALPRYNKSANAGAGDRLPAAVWPEAEAVDVVLLEGWCLGFEPGPPPTPPPLQRVEEALSSFSSLHDILDCFVTMGALDIDFVYRWREEAEAERRARGEGAMTQAEVTSFVDRYMPMYQRCLSHLYQRGPLPPDRTLRLWLDHARRAVDAPSGRIRGL